MAIIPHRAGEGNPEEIPLESALRAQSKPFRVSDGVLTVAAVLLSGSAGFGLGYLSGQEGMGEEKGFRIGESGLSASVPLGQVSGLVEPSSRSKPSTYKAPAKIEPKGTATAETGTYVASKSGEKYHLPTCSGAKAMKESNKIWFTTKEEAEAAGYTPAANCKGI